MEKEQDQINNVSIVIANDFKISDTESLIPSGDFRTLEEFKIYLIQKLTFLLDNSFDSLINILYKIDVNEERLKELFGGRNREHIPTALADLIIARSIQKVKFRQKYKDGEL
ncbi:MAG: hypothetical protein PVF17_08505 [Ignavibacteria bacterium]